MKWNTRVYGYAVVFVATLGILAATPAAHAVSDFTGRKAEFRSVWLILPGRLERARRRISANNFNGRNDILLNPGIGQSAYATIPNNTTSTGIVNWLPGQYIYNIQVGGGNSNGPFGAGAAAISGGLFGYSLADGGVPGGFSTSYEIMGRVEKV